jgi:hypothetical protein
MQNIREERSTLSCLEAVSRHNGQPSEYPIAFTAALTSSASS